MTDQLDRLKAALADRYSIERELGRGGMAVVYLAQDKKLNRQVALKVLRPELAASLGTERFFREIEIAAKLTHPNILGLYDCGSVVVPTVPDRPAGSSTGPSTGLLYYTMPFVEGESLRDRLNREKQLPIDDALQITREVADALGHAHSLGIVHRDIKPENILFTAGHAVVSDFGIARAVSEAGGEKLTETGLAVGTPMYMSPEQASGIKDIDARSDVYSLGCVLYEMLSGDPPFTGSTPQAVLARKSVDTPQPIRSVRDTVPDTVEHALLKSLARVPADRYRTPHEFVEALEEQASPIQPTTRGPLGPLAAAVTVAVLAVLGGWWVSGLDNTTLDRRLVAVVPLENRTGDPRLDYLSHLFAERAIAYAQGEDVAEFAPLVEIEAAVDGGGTANPVSAVAERTGAGLVVTGSYYLLGDTVSVQGQLVDAEAGRQSSAIAPVSAARDDLGSLVNRLAERITVHLFAELHQDYLLYGAFQYGEPTLEALRLCEEGQQLNAAGLYEESLDRFMDAWEIDTLWVAPLWMASGPLHNMRDYARSDSLTRIAFRLRNQVSESVRLATQSSLAYYDGDFEPARQYRCQAAEADANRDPVRVQNCAWFSIRGNWPRRALQAYQDAAQAQGVPPLELPSPFLMIAATAYHMIGDYESELTIVHQLRSRDPEGLEARYAGLRALVGLGRVEEVDRGVEELATIAVDSINAIRRMSGVGLELRYHGYPQVGKRVLRRAALLLEEHFIDDSSADSVRLDYATVLYHLEDWGGAWRELSTLHVQRRSAEIREQRGKEREIEIKGYLGLAAARLGDTASAATYERRLRERDAGARYLFGLAKGYVARIAAVQERREEAVGMLRQALAEGLGFWPVSSSRSQYRFDFEALADYEPYQELMRPKG